MELISMKEKQWYKNPDVNTYIRVVSKNGYDKMVMCEFIDSEGDFWEAEEYDGKSCYFTEWVEVPNWSVQKYLPQKNYKIWN